MQEVEKNKNITMGQKQKVHVLQEMEPSPVFGNAEL